MQTMKLLDENMHVIVAIVAVCIAWLL
eukprot:SAG31_NODE_39589_length_287_cov_0.813830_1_plen_26_part_10